MSSHYVYQHAVLFLSRLCQPLTYQQRDGQVVPVCQNDTCGFVFWQNSKPCVSVLIPDHQGHILMTVRAYQPDQGKLDLPGGFLQEGEHPDDGTRREIHEELGVEIEIINFLGFVVDRYGTNGDYTLNIGIIGKIRRGTPRAADDAEAIEWINPATVNSQRLAFTNNARFLHLWIQRTRK